jgi:hypothetical protein
LGPSLEYMQEYILTKVDCATYKKYNLLKHPHCEQSFHSIAL